jgi:putative membrane protein
VIAPGVGWLLVVASLYRAVTIALNTLGWQRLIPAQHRPSAHLLFLFRWIGEAVNSLIPWGQAGGDVVRAQLLSRRGVPWPEATALMLADLSIAAVTQVLFTLLGVAAAAAKGLPTSKCQLLVLALTTAGIIGLLAVAGSVVPRTLAGPSATRRWPAVARRIQELRSALRTLAVDRRALVVAAAWHLLAWLSQVVETWMVLAARQAPVTWSGALWLESLTTAARSAAFFLPGGLGAQEAALIALGRHLGIDPPPLVTLAVVKRGREIVVGVLGLTAWALLRRKRPDKAGGPG